MLHAFWGLGILNVRKYLRMGVGFPHGIDCNGSTDP